MQNKSQYITMTLLIIFLTIIIQSPISISDQTNVQSTEDPIYSNLFSTNNDNSNNNQVKSINNTNQLVTNNVSLNQQQNWNYIDISSSKHPDINWNNEEKYMYSQSTMGNLSSDGISDIVVISNEGHLRVINGANGDTINSVTLDLHGISTLISTELSGDNTDDIIITGRSDTNNDDNWLYILNGQTLDLLNPIFTSFFPNRIVGSSIANFDSDSDEELIVSTYNGVNTSSFRMYDLDTLTLSKTFQISSDLSLKIAKNTSDFNSDNIDDILLYNQPSTIVYDVDNDNIVFNQTSFKSFTDINLGDINDDGTDDIAIGGMLLDGTNGNELISNSIFISNTIADYDKDGETEVLFTSGGIFYAFNNTSSAELALDVVDASYKDIIIHDYNNDTVNDIIAYTGQRSLLVFNWTNNEVINEYDQISDTIADLFLDDFTNDGLTDILVITEDTTVTGLITDTFQPIINYIRLPEIRTSDIMEFEVGFSEPNIDTIELIYNTTFGPISETPVQITDDTAVFEIQYNQPEFVFWIEIQDQFGHKTQAGNQNNPYTFNINSETPVRSFFSINNVVSGVPQPDVVKDSTIVDFNKDGIPDIIANGYQLVSSPPFYIPTPVSSIIYQDGKSDLTSRYIPFYQSVVTIESGEVTNDNQEDVIVASINATGVSIHIDDFSDNQFESVYVEGDFTEQYFDVQIIDVDIDGTNEIVLNGDNQIYIVEAINLNISIIHFSNFSMIEKFEMRQLNTGSLDIITLNLDRDSIVARDGDNSDLLFSTLNSWTIDDFILGDINNDQQEELLVLRNDGADTVVYNYDLFGTQVGKYQFTNRQFNDLVIINADQDQYRDIMLLDSDSDRITAFSPVMNNTIYTNIIDELEYRVDINDHMLVNDVTRDQIDDIMIIGDRNIYSINSQTGLLYDSYDHDNTIISDTYFYDTDGNGIDELFFTDIDGYITGYQSPKPFTSLQYSIQGQSTLKQGEAGQFILYISDYANRYIQGASVSITAIKEGSGNILTVFGRDVGLGDYLFNFTTENWELGTYHLYPSISRDPFESISLNNFRTVSGNILTQGDTISITGKVQPSFTLSAHTKQSTTDEITGVEEGEKIDISFSMTDAYNHVLENTTNTPYNISATFNNRILPIDIANNNSLIQTSIDTTDLDYGRYNVSIRIVSQFVDNTEFTLSVEIVPSFPEIKYDIIDNFQMVSIVFIVASVLIYYWKRIYLAFDNNPEQVFKYNKIVLLINSVLFLVSIAGLYYLYNGTDYTDIEKFLFSLVPVGLSILLVFSIHVYLNLKQYYQQQFSILSWIGLIILSLVVAMLLGVSIWLGRQSQWISYQMQQSTTNLIITEIPTIVWEIGIYGFATGFLYVLFIDAYDTYSDINYLHETQQKIELGYYPKEPNKLYNATVEEIRSSFTSVSKGFLVWYGVIIFTSITSLNLHSFIFVIALMFATLVLASFILLRTNIFTFLDLNDTASDQTMDGAKTSGIEVDKESQTEIDDMNLDELTEDVLDDKTEMTETESDNNQSEGANKTIKSMDNEFTGKQSKKIEDESKKSVNNHSYDVKADTLKANDGDRSSDDTINTTDQDKETPTDE